MNQSPDAGVPPLALAAPEPPPQTSRRRWALVCLFVVWLAFSAPAFIGRVRFPVDFAGAFAGPAASRVTPPNQAPSNLTDADTFFAYYPFHAVLGEALAQGHLPLWDASRFIGAPYAANEGMGTFYPPHWLYALGDPLRVETLIWSGSILLCLLLAFWFLAMLDLHPYAAAIGSVVWTFSGFLMGWSAHDGIVGAAVWLPLALGGLEMARQGRARWGVPLAGLALALSILAGHLQTALYVWLAVAIWAGVCGTVSLLGAARTGRSGRAGVRRELLRSLALPLCAAAIGAGFASAQIIGVLQLANQSIRQDVSYASATSAPRPDPVAAGRLNAKQLPTALIPDYYGNPLDNNYDYKGAPPNYTQTTFYAGIIVLPLVAAGLFHRNRRVLGFFALVTVVGALSAFGTPFYRILFTLVPGMARLPAIQRFIFLIDVGLAGLAALGLDAILSRAGRAPVRAAGCVALVSAGAIVTLTIARWGTRVPAAYITPRGLRALAFALAGGAIFAIVRRAGSRLEALGLILVVLAGADLWLYGFTYHPFAAPRPVYGPSGETAYLATLPGPRPRFVQTFVKPGIALLPPNASMVYHLYSLNGYDEFIPARFARLLELVDPQASAAAVANFIPPLQANTIRSPILDLLGVTAVATPLDNHIAGVAGFTGLYFSVFQEPTALPPAFVATCWQEAPDSTVLARLATMSGAQLRSTAIVSRAGTPDTLGPPPADCPPGPPVTVDDYQPSRVGLSATATRAGVLVLSDQWYPGWQVKVDGHRAQTLLVDYALRGVAIGPGAHRIEFDYRPSWPLQGLGMALLTLLACAAWVLAPAAHRRRRKREPQEATRVSGSV